MSDRIRSTISQDLMEKEFVSVEDKTQCLASSIYEITKSNPFMGSVLQSLTISYGHTLPTAGIMFNTDQKKWDMYINPYFFCKKLTSQNRKAILLHELSHITHKHPLRVPFLKISTRKQMLMNVAMDMAINQYIKDIPRGCSQCPPPGTGVACKNELCPGSGIDVADYFDIDPSNKNKVQWPLNHPMEDYYNLLIKRFEDPDDEDSEDSGDNAGGGAASNDIPQTIDEHLWDGAAEEKDMLDATEELMKRAMVKARLSYDELPNHVKELLDEIKIRHTELNYKGLIMSALKRHAAGHDRKHTWTRKSKRFGYKAPGTKVGDLPKLELHIDSSGSISIEELNEFLAIVDEFLRVGARKCNISFFHTNLYGREPYKMGMKFDKSKIQSGGTELTETLKDILKRKGDLSVIITDGCYGDVPFESWMRPGEHFPQVLWVISKQGTEEHPLKRIGSTVKVPDPATVRK